MTEQPKGKKICNNSHSLLCPAGWLRPVVGIAFLFVLIWGLGCTTPSNTPSDPSKQEVRDDADRFSEKLEKEERQYEKKPREKEKDYE